MSGSSYWMITALVLLAALAVLAAGLKLLLRRHWLLGWLRGCIGLVLVAGALALAAAGWDLHRYQALTAESPVATLAFTRLAPQQYRVAVVDVTGTERLFNLYGDLWQLDVRVIKWHPRLASLGVRPGYQLERLSGRYLALEQEQQSPRSVHGLSAAPVGVDIWQWLRRHDRLSGLVDARYGSASYLPMADKAKFSVTMGPSGLIARADNAPARIAVESW